MKFRNLDELLDFEKNLVWVGEKDIVLDDAKRSIQYKANRLKGEKLFGVYNGEVISVISEQFKPISVTEISNACENIFGGKYEEKSYREGIVRIYDKGVEDRIGEVKPIVIYPANLGSMAVNIGIHHNAFVCSNGLLVSDRFLTRRIMHRGLNQDFEQLAKEVSANLGVVLNNVSNATMIELSDSYQLAMIVQGLDQKENLINKALNKYAPQDNSLWETIQSITYVARDQKKKGFQYSKNAGEFLIKKGLEPYEVISAASYLFSKQAKGQLGICKANELYQQASKLLAQV